MTVWTFLFLALFCLHTQASSRDFNFMLMVADDSIKIEQACQKIADKLSSVDLDECLANDFIISGYSENNFPLMITEFPPLAGRQPLGRILLIGGIHGDELSSVSVSFKWLNTLRKYHSGLFHWKVIPLMNPDGLLQKKSKRYNRNGVDLNRNFPSLAQPQAHLDYWIERTRKNKRKYPGKYPLSEAESTWLVRQIKAFRPDVIITIHAPYGIVDFDGHKKDKPPKHLGPLHLHLLGTYPGSLGRYGSEVLKIPVITVELSYAGIMPSKQDIKRIWSDLVAWLKGHLQQKNSKEQQHPDANSSISEHSAAADIVL